MKQPTPSSGLNQNQETRGTHLWWDSACHLETGVRWNIFPGYRKMHGPGHLDSAAAPPRPLFLFILRVDDLAWRFPTPCSSRAWVGRTGQHRAGPRAGDVLAQRKWPLWHGQTEMLSGTDGEALFGFGHPSRWHLLFRTGFSLLTLSRCRWDLIIAIHDHPCSHAAVVLFFA